MKTSTFLFIFLILTTLSMAEPVPQLSEPGTYETYLRISPNGRYVAVDHSKTVTLWDIESMQKLHTMKNFERVSSVQFSPDGKSIVVADYPRWIGYFDLDGGFRKRWTFKAPWSGSGSVQSAGSYGLQFSDDGKIILAQNGSHGAQMGDHVARFFSASNGQVLHSHPKWTGRQYRSEIGFVDNKTFVRGKNDKLQLFSILTGEKLHEARTGGQIDFLRVFKNQDIICEHKTDNGSKSVIGEYSKSDLNFLRKLSVLEPVPFKHPDGKLEFGRKDGKLVVASGETVVYEGTKEEKIFHWVPGGGFVVNVGYGYDEKSRVYGADGKKLSELESGFRFLPPSPLAISIQGYGSPCSVVDLRRGREIVKLSFASDAKVSKDGRRLAVKMKTGVLLVDVPTTLEQGELVLVK